VALWGITRPAVAGATTYVATRTWCGNLRGQSVPGAPTYVNVAFLRSTHIATYADRQQTTCMWVSDGGCDTRRVSAPNCHLHETHL